MPRPSFSNAHALRHPRRFFCKTAALILASTTCLLAQQPANPTSATKAAPEKAKPALDESASAATQTLAQFNDALENLAAKVSPAVVQILVTGYGPLREQSRSETSLIVRQHAVGSGVIVDPNGYIMTNAHVVEGAQRIRVALPLPTDGGRSVAAGKRHVLEARLVGVHKETDLALLKIDEKDLPTLVLLAQQRPRVGQLVFAIGGSEGLRFAIPARIVDFVYRSLRKYGHVHRTEIGAVAQEITPTLADGLKLAQHWGVIIADVKPDGPAAASGLQVQDIVLTADDRRIETLPQLSSALYLHRLDQVLKLEILRGDQKKTLYVPAIEHRDEMDQLFDAADPEKNLISRLGILATDLTDDLRSKIGTLRIPSGVVVLGRAADLILPDTGLQTGDIIHSLDTTPITSMDALRATLLTLKTGDPVVLQVERSDGLTYLSFEME